MARYFKMWAGVFALLYPALATIRITIASSALHDALTDVLDRALPSQHYISGTSAVW
ncbi:MAG: hypothetical protein QXE66_00470 [Desulfurococcaceae archaeon]